MNYTKFLIISVFLFGFIGAADVFASSHSKHEMHDHGVVSPFDKKQVGKPLHCLLNNHSFKDAFCPHTRSPSGEDSTCLLYTSPSPRDGLLSRMPSSA